MNPILRLVLFGLFVIALCLVGAALAWVIHRQKGRWWAKIGMWAIALVLVLFVGMLGRDWLEAYNLLPSVLIFLVPIASLIPIIWYIRRQKMGRFQRIGFSVAGAVAVVGVFFVTVLVCFFWPSNFQVFRSKVTVYVMTHQSYAFSDSLLLGTSGKKEGDRIALFPTNKSEKFVSIIEEGSFASGKLRDGVVEYDNYPKQKIDLWWVLTKTYTISTSVE